MPRLSGEHSFNIGASRVPVHCTFPMAPMKPVLLLLPEHSSVAVIVVRLRALMSARPSVAGFLTSPEISRRQFATSNLGTP